MNILSGITIIIYVVAAVIQGRYVFARAKANKLLVFILSFIGICLHGYLLYKWIEVSGSQNLALLNLISLSSWVLAILVVSMSWIKPLDNLSILILPFAAISIIGANFAGDYLVPTKNNTLGLIHILIAILAVSVLGLSLAQALILSCQHKILKVNPAKLMVLPPLETMEKSMFQFMSIGFLLLSVTLVTGFISASPVTIPYILEKTLFASSAWFIFAGLLTGRYVAGWRGITAIRWTSFAMLLLAFTYIGSQKNWSLLFR